MLKFIKTQGAKIATVATLAVATVSAHAADNPITTMLGEIDLSGVATAVTAAGVLIVGIALAFKAPDVAKRAVRKV